MPIVSAGHEREPAHRAFPKMAEEWDISRIIEDYADAAERMKTAGLDGIELQAYGHLMDQFWSPLTNQLDEPYGGNLGNRLRFTFDTLRAIRARVGPDFIVGVRYTGDENLPGGLNREDGLEISRRLKDSGMVDFLNVVKGHIDTDAGLTEVIPVQGMRSASHLDFAGEVRALTRTTVSTGFYQGGMALCLHNPATGRELEQPHVVPEADTRPRVVIIGAGAAGLEAARVAAERGHAVIVHEAATPMRRFTTRCGFARCFDVRPTKTILVVSAHAEGEVGDVLVGGVLPRPVTRSANKAADTPSMSVSNSICAATVLLDGGLVPMQEPGTRLAFEAPGGLVRVRAKWHGGKAERI